MGRSRPAVTHVVEAVQPRLDLEAVLAHLLRILAVELAQQQHLEQAVKLPLRNLVPGSHAGLPRGSVAALLCPHANEEQRVVRHALVDEEAQVVAITQVLERLGGVLDRELGHVRPAEHVFEERTVQS